MEEQWAARIAAAVDPSAELDRFPYLGNYHDFVRLELASLDAVGLPTPRRAVVLGSGPLPLTGLLLAARHDIEVLHVDRAPAATRAGGADMMLVGALVGADAPAQQGQAGSPGPTPTAKPRDPAAPWSDTASQSWPERAAASACPRIGRRS